MKITSTVYLVGGSTRSDPADAAIYLIRGNGESALVDAGTGRGHSSVVKNIESLAIPLKQIKKLFITHCHYDHTGGIIQLQKATDCSVVAHELDARYIEEGDSEVTAASWYGAYMEPSKVHEKVEGARPLFDVGGLEVAFYHAPGHSPGSSILTMESDGRLVLFGQDVHGPLNDSLRSNRSDYRKSLEFMLSLEADILCEGHFGVFIGKEKVRDFIEQFLS
jgi:glyoxylase-like metal-dependent hydrolase (beta-lactamase superfamily II)